MTSFDMTETAVRNVIIIGSGPAGLTASIYAARANLKPLCIEGFNTYLRSFPRSEAAGDAQFYIGECNFADGKYTEAMDAYNRVIATYPRADKAPDAYYKRGMTFERLGQLDRARESWETLIKTFPDAEVARLGKQNLDRLARAKPRA